MDLRTLMQVAQLRRAQGASTPKLKLLKQGGNSWEQKVFINLAENVVFLTKLPVRRNMLWK